MSVAVITGASKGIGRALALMGAEKGYDLALCSRTLADLEVFKAELLAINSDIKVFVQAVDMSKKEEVKAFGAAILQEFEQLDLVINNAGVFIPCPLTEAGHEQSFELMMDTNLYSAYYLTQALLPKMQAQKLGHVFNICSIASFMPYGAYAVSKHAMLGFSRVLREEVKAQGIRVTAVMPGATYTASWEGTELPQERFMKAEDIAQSVWDCHGLSPQTVVEEIILRPQLGDI